MNKKLISLIICVLNEEGNVKELQKQISEVLADMPDVDAEVIYVNDGSTDLTLLYCRELQKTDPRIKIVNFTKNFGKEVAMIAGLEYAKGDAIIFMDADLQNPPKYIKDMVREWQNGEKIVLMKRLNDVQPGLLYKICNRLFYWGLNFISDVKIPKAMPDFRLLDREYVEFLKKFDERDSMFRGMLSLITDMSKQKIIEYTSPERNAGETKYKFGFRSIKLALDSVFQFSVRPLYLAMYFAVIVGVISAGLGTYVIIERFILGNPTPGYAAIMSAITFTGAAILFVLGIIGMYMAKIHLEVKKRPLYFAEYFE